MLHKTISSNSNPQIKRLRALGRQNHSQEGSFVLEGLRLVQSAFDAHYPLECVYLSDSFALKHVDVIAAWQAAGLELVQVKDEIFRSLGSTVNPQGVLALAPRPVGRTEQIHSYKRLLVLDNLRDPGNLGTILRTAQATAVEGALLSPGCVDAFAPKVVRAGMGAHFRLVIIKAEWEEIASYCQEKHCILADAGGDTLYWDIDWAEPVVLIISNEAYGPSPQAINLADQTVRLPMADGAESLNAAVAASVLMYEIYRSNRVK